MIEEQEQKQFKALEDLKTEENKEENKEEKIKSVEGLFLKETRTKKLKMKQIKLKNGKK